MTDEYRVGVAPRFHVKPSWPDRLRVNGGCERVEDGFVAEADWRPPTADELARLTRPGPADSAVSLFNVPGHILADWESVTGQLDEPTAFTGFARAVVDFLRYKGVPLPLTCGCDAVMTAPGRSSVFGLGPPSALGLLNLGDEPTGIAFLPLQTGAVAKMLLRANVQSGPLAETFLDCFPHHPLVKIALARGEGCWLPPAGAVIDLTTVGQTAPGVVLTFRAEAGPPP